MNLPESSMSATWVTQHTLTLHNAPEHCATHIDIMQDFENYLNFLDLCRFRDLVSFMVLSFSIRIQI